MSTIFRESQHFNIEQKELLQKCELALKACKFKVTGFFPEAGLLLAKTRFSIWSFAEDVTVKVEPNGNVMMQSVCSLPYTQADWGKNRRNIKKFFTKLKPYVEG